MEKNPYLLQGMYRDTKTSFLVSFDNSNFPNDSFLYVYKYGPGERVNFYHLDGSEVTVNVATWLREAMNHVFNEE